jgi:anaerobic dimethyl sulfoxide reductase subunit C (anchor subunit)
MEIQWTLVLFTMLSGTGAGLFLFAVLGHQFIKDRIDNTTLTIASVAALVLLVAGGIASVFHLHHAERILEALNHPTTGIFLEALTLGITSVIIVVFLLVMMRTDGESAALKIIGVIGILSAAVFMFVVGQSYMLHARPTWDTVLLPLSYLATAATTSAAFYLFLLKLRKQVSGAVVFAGRCLLIVGLLAAVVVVAFGMVTGTATGEQAAIFWGLVIAVGLVIPAGCGLFAQMNPDKATTIGFVALCATPIGCIAFRCFMWIVGASILDLFAEPRY